MPCKWRTYATWIQANNTLRAMKKMHGFRGAAFVCPVCGLIHIGKNKKVKRQEQRRR
jgi:predicted RNA-binding Zn-ribbon protein involved in translation (DUF1610 family)